MKRQPAGLSIIIWCFFSLLALDGMTCWATGESREYQIKAAFLLNFAQFIQWPANAFATPDAPFVIGVLGDDPFRAALDQTVEGETVRSRKIVLRRGRTADELKDCQMIFLGKSEEAHMREVLLKLGKSPVLTISEIRGFARRGGIIDFYPEGGKVRFEINPGAAEERGLKINSQLLSLGRIVKTEKEEN
jgi:hypothetical protein